jgi:uncharacterized protein (TIGR00645 family)
MNNASDETRPVNAAEKILLTVPRYMLLILLISVLVMMAGYAGYIGYESVKLGIHIFEDEVPKSEITIGVLETVDGILIWSVVFLIVFGTFSNYIVHNQNQDKLPPALQNMTSGKLKEKLSSSLITASAVYLFKIVVESTASGEITLEQFLIVGGIHLLFIVGYFVIAHSNRNDPSHAAPTPSGEHH